jgi:hypothetical protein
VRAKQALEKVRSAQIEALSVYQNAIRVAAREGGTVREIATEVGMSHQRVHQILQAGCDLCERGYKQVAQLVAAGKHLTICNHCIDRAEAVLRGKPSSGEPRIEPVAARSKAVCDSCGQPAKKVKSLLRAAGTHVCDTCWHAAAHIIATHPLSDPVGIEGLD